MTNAALFTHPDGFDTSVTRLLGRHSAGEGFLRGFLRYADVEQIYLWHGGVGSAATLEAMIRRLEPTDRPINWLASTQRGRLSEVGVLNLVGPNLGPEAWARGPYGAHSYSICGLTHTTATARTMDDLRDMLIAPAEGHDALICTSSAVRASVETHLDLVRDYLCAEYGGPRRRAEPLRTTIPLGVHVDDFQTTPADRAAWRERLGIPDDAIVALYVGRFHAREKMNPALMALALERAARQLDQPLYWVNSGWGEPEAEAAAYHGAARALCPTVHYRQVDGRPPDTRFSIWSVADLFISFSDNIQESFGLTPVEAMAAGLPAVVTDWNGYRDTVRHGEDGFRVPTFAPRAGDGEDLAYRQANRWLSYTDYVGGAAQFTAIDYAAATEAIAGLATNADLRRKLGDQAKARARAVFDWSAIIPQYQTLWAELNVRRQAASPAPPRQDNPFRPDPFRLFAAYPTHSPSPDWTVTLSPGTGWQEARALLTSPLAAYGDINRPTLRECEEIVAWLGSNPGASLAEVGAQFRTARQSAIIRGLLWIARFGVIELSPPA